MEIYFGIEALEQQAKHYLTQLQIHVDTDVQLFIFRSNHDALAIANKLNLPKDEIIEVYHLQHPDITDLFLDYGFLSTNQECYLYKEMTIPFKIYGGEKEQIEMAKYQIDEHLIAIDQYEKEHLYFVDRTLIDLMTGIAKAYDIEVSFLDLDKIT